MSLIRHQSILSYDVAHETAHNNLPYSSSPASLLKLRFGAFIRISMLRNVRRWRMRVSGVNYKGEFKGVGGYKRTASFQWMNGGRAAYGVACEGQEAFRADISIQCKKEPGRLVKVHAFPDIRKITDTLICMTEVIKPSRTQNAKARRAAHLSAHTPCKLQNS